MKTNTRSISRIVPGFVTSDGAGVKLKRTIGGIISEHDPFLLLDEFKSEDGTDYIAGFPDHPHRGFETVTYMLQGRMQHRDSRGNEGIIETGGVQWMTAGRGLIHSEMPLQTDGMMWGFQLWVNLPAKLKMCQPRYQDIPKADVPEVEYDNGTKIRVIAGSVDNQNGETVLGCVKGIITNPLYLDVLLKPSQKFSKSLPADHSAFIYSFVGTVSVGNKQVPVGHLAILEDGDHIQVENQSGSDARFLVVAAQKLDEPIARRGPFVMNTRKELIEAFQDYSSGLLY